LRYDRGLRAVLAGLYDVNLRQCQSAAFDSPVLQSTMENKPSCTPVLPANAVGLPLTASQIQGQVKLMKQASLRQLDKWGQQFPVRLLALCLQSVQGKDLAACLAVCLGWKLPLNPADNLWKSCYLLDYEAETSSDLAIASDGEQTAWSKRY